LKVVAGKEPADSDTPAVPDSTAVDPEGSNAPAETIQRNEAQAAAQTETAEPAPDRQLEQEQPEETTEENQTPEFDLSTPHATATTFIKMLVASDIESVMACMLPNSPCYDAVQQLLQLQPGDFAYDAKLWYQALDPDADMSLIEQNDTPDGVEIVWLVTLKTDVNLRGKQIDAGEQGRLGATVIPVDGQWLIDSIINMDD